MPPKSSRAISYVLAVHELGRLRPVLADLVQQRARIEEQGDPQRLVSIVDAIAETEAKIAGFERIRAAMSNAARQPGAQIALKVPVGFDTDQMFDLIQLVADARTTMNLDAVVPQEIWFADDDMEEPLGYLTPMGERGHMLTYNEIIDDWNSLFRRREVDNYARNLLKARLVIRAIYDQMQGMGYVDEFLQAAPRVVNDMALQRFNETMRVARQDRIDEEMDQRGENENTTDPLVIDERVQTDINDVQRARNKAKDELEVMVADHKANPKKAAKKEEAPKSKGSGFFDMTKKLPKDKRGGGRGGGGGGIDFGQAAGRLRRMEE